jgi:DNA-binding transcriptional ArsR family regulator
MGAPANDVFRAIADPTRRDILSGLAAGPRTVSEICGDFAISQPAVSAHLEILRDAGLVQVRPEGRHRVYSLDPSPLREVDVWVAKLTRFWDGKLKNLGRALDGRAARDRRKRGT